MIIDGFSMAGYRSFGPDIQKFGPCSKINFIIGQNNSGKSNVLSYISDQYPQTIRSLQSSKSPLTWSGTNHFTPLPTLKAEVRPGFGLGVSKDSGIYTTMQDKLWRMERIGQEKVAVQSFLDGMIAHDQLLWFEFVQDEDRSDRLAASLKWLASAQEVLRQAKTNIRELCRIMTGTSYSDEVSAGTDILTTLCKAAFPTAPTILFVPAMRKIKLGIPESRQHDGSGVIEQLFHLQQPDFDEQHLLERFAVIKDLLRTVTGHSDLEIQIPHRSQSINVKINGRMLPLASLGTGIEELLIIATIATSIDNHVICIEEPEIHLHPALQKRLILYLNEQTNNQYFITTHSASLLDACSDAAVFHVQLENGSSIVDAAVTSNKRFQICTDLGYRASDLLQANCIVWVEGPSDRIYLNRWIKDIDKSLVEGIHYSIMFHGGALRSHLTADDKDVEDFISLRRLNRHVAMLIDSDKDSEMDTINATKRRLIDEIAMDGGYVWVTMGREVENYIPDELRLSAIKAVHNKIDRLEATGDFSHPLYVIRNLSDKEQAKGKTACKTDVDKVGVARAVVQSETDWAVLDLRAKVTELVEYIRSANHFPPLNAAS
jgi:hypothetical protein